VSSDTLSQYDIDRLLGGAGASLPATQMSSPGASKGQSQEETEVTPYDFRRPHRVSKERLRTLEAMYERMVKSLEGWLISRVRGQIEMRLQSVEQFSFGEFTLSLPTPCATYIFDVQDSGGQQGAIDIGHEFAYFLVDRLFGGSGVPTILDRPLSPIERMAVRSVAERVVAHVAEAWQDYIELELNLSGFESIPEILRAANPEDPVLVANIEVATANFTSLLLICLPFAVLDKFFAGSSERRVTVLGSSSEIQALRGMTENSVRGARVPVSARLPEFRLAMGQLLELKPGSILATGLPRTSLLDVLVGTQRRFQATPGRLGSTLAVRLLDRVGPTSDNDSAQPTRS